jgi:hypothetical protein
MEKNTKKKIFFVGVIRIYHLFISKSQPKRAFLYLKILHAIYFFNFYFLILADRHIDQFLASSSPRPIIFSKKYLKNEGFFCL